MKTMPPQETLSRILVAAESLFAENGYDGTTLRQITRHAKVNLAAVNYHHGDKESLYLEVLTRRIRPINQARLARLSAAEAQAAGGRVPLDQLFHIMAEPLFGLCADADERSPQAVRLLGRCLVEPLPFMADFLAAEFQPVMTRFGQALRRHTPALSPTDFLWRLNFVVGAMQHTLASLHHVKDLTQGICQHHDHAAALSCFVQLACRAFEPAPSPDRGLDR